MAYDKVIDSSVLDGNLTSIANAIREKAELTENFAFPQGFIDAISGIESGGGGMIYNTGSFTVAEIKSTYTHQIEHNLGVIPNFLMVFPESPITPNADCIQAGGSFLICFNMNDSTKHFGNNIAIPKNSTNSIATTNYSVGYKLSGDTVVGNHADNGVSFINAGEKYVSYKTKGPLNSATTICLLPGVTYRWLIGYLELNNVNSWIDEGGGIV